MRALHLDLWTILFWRGAFGGLSLMALAIWEGGWSAWRPFLALDRAALALVPVSALGMASYVAALSLTSVADVMIVYATLPFVAIAIAWLWGREVPTRETLLASVGALFGVAVMASADRGASQVLGLVLVFMMNIEFAALIVMARRRRGSSMTPVNLLAALLGSLIAAPLAPTLAVDARDLVLLAGYGFICVGAALGLYMAGARRVAPAEAGLIGLADVVLGPLWVWLAFSENPGSASLLGGAIVLVAVATHFVRALSDPTAVASSTSA